MANSDILCRLSFAASTQFHVIVTRLLLLARGRMAGAVQAVRSEARALRLIADAIIGAILMLGVVSGGIAVQPALLPHDVTLVLLLAGFSFIGYRAACCASERARRRGCSLLPRPDLRGSRQSINRGRVVETKFNTGRGGVLETVSAVNDHDVFPHLLPVFAGPRSRPLSARGLDLQAARDGALWSRGEMCDKTPHVVARWRRRDIRRKPNSVWICLEILSLHSWCGFSAGTGFIRDSLGLQRQAMLQKSS